MAFKGGNVQFCIININPPPTLDLTWDQLIPGLLMNDLSKTDLLTIKNKIYDPKAQSVQYFLPNCLMQSRI